ncbi:MAG: ATP-binding protein [Chloroflexi bacterium]|nr:ATP-binding protein [Chloroflexota bacterium]
MLIRFFVENFLSFKDEVEFSMVAGESDEHSDHIHKVRDMRILKTGVIFGANASGKTNLIKAMSFAQNFITSGSFETDNLTLTPFLLDSKSASKPSEFMFEIQCGVAQCFQYYFSVDRQRVHRETLYEILAERTAMIFERETDSQGHTNVKIGEVNVLVTNEEDHFDFIRKFGPNELFLTAVNTEGNTGINVDDDQHDRMGENLNGRDARLFIERTPGTTLDLVATSASPKRPEPRIAFLDIIYDWFDRTLVLVFPDSIPTQGIGLGMIKGEDLERRLKELIDVFDLGIDGFDLQPIDFNAESNKPADLAQHIQDVIKQIPNDTDQRAVFGRYGNEQYLTVDAASNFSAYKLVTLHNRPNDEHPVPLDLMAESDGTRRLLMLLPALFRLHSGQSDHVFVIDELDRSLHTHLTYNVLDQFLTSSGQSRSQLVVTTHDTGLLDFDLLRRDEIWFIEKDRNSSSTLFSLEEFKLPDNMNIQKGYLGGRFGAIPILSILHEHMTAE